MTKPIPIKNKVLKESFIKYLEEHPSERFWQAVRNWSGHEFIYAMNGQEDLEGGGYDFTSEEDTFYWNKKDKI